MKQWQKVAEQITGAITARSLEVGEELPSLRDAAAALGVSINTIVLAYHVLSDTGVLLRSPHRHYAVAQPLRYCDFFVPRGHVSDGPSRFGWHAGGLVLEDTAPPTQW
ncbi:GntR family transcriptional regulator [Curtobacterium sp. DN_7.5]|uniref:GntR family transcriptional regulator n=1 Tax=Curtobacterium sp. DN_7.5 TaxID=3049047 RepID=UPI001F583B0D|nr:GntR family transcriptional regulator [Curtobacterium sp. DN_7.5]